MWYFYLHMSILQGGALKPTNALIAEVRVSGRD